MSEQIPWSPDHAQFVTGSYEPREFDPSTGMYFPQRVVADCSICGAHWETMCASGQVRDHIARFGSVHKVMHHDVLAAPKIVRPTSLRREEVTKRSGG